MPLTLPRLDDRSYNEILRETIARIPAHTPEWTNFNDSDPGITLLQLFAFMTENLLYRSNLIPDRNRIKFLQLLAVPMRAASAARGVVALVNLRGPLETITLPAGVPVMAGRIGFVTTRGLDVLPIEARAYYRRKLTGQEELDAKQAHDQLFESQTDDQTELEFYRTVPFEAPTSASTIRPIDLGDPNATVDRALWIALLARPNEDRHEAAAAIAGRVLTVGLVSAADESTRVLLPGGAPASQQAPPIDYDLSSRALTSDGLPAYRKLSADEQRSDGITLVQLPLPDAEAIEVWDEFDPGEEGVGDFPPVLEDEDVRKRLLAWVRIRLRLPDADAAGAAGLKLLYSWAGINATRVTQRSEVVGEPVGSGTGEPDQRFSLVNTPVIADSVRLIVGGEVWTRTDDLLSAPPEVPVQDPSLPPGSPPPPSGNPNVFTVDAESGQITCGDGVRGGRRPPLDARVFATYAYGGGSAGNVGIGAIKTSPLLPAGFQVTNPLPTWGGAEGETVTEAERSIPHVLRHRNRAVSKEDFADIVRRTPGVDLGRVEILPLFHPINGSPAPGVVTVLVVPNDRRRPEGPVPDQFFLRAVCEYLEPRRLLTSEVHVRGPEYVSVSVSIGITVVAGREIATVREAVKAAVRRLLSPIFGGLEGGGWPLDRSVDDREVLVAAARVEGVTKVNQVLVWGSSSDPVPSASITGLQLPRLDRLAVAIGDADNVMAQTETPTGKPKRRLPVPTVPPEC
jgi:predicted phage baseplate assembly protein